jgi:hypothetical protein
MAIMAPPNNKAAARPIRADLVMIFSLAISRTTGKTSDRRRLFPES